MTIPSDDNARPYRWQIRASAFVSEIWHVHSGSYAFLATRNPKTDQWRDHIFALPISNKELIDHFTKFPRDQYDHYFCPNAFSLPIRKTIYARRSPYAWVDIDSADPNAFVPSPNILIETSPGRFQGIWKFEGKAKPTDAELYSKALAYNFGADRNGWSATKYLRVPGTRNHKVIYDLPPVKLVRCSYLPQPRVALRLRAADVMSTSVPVVHVKLIMPRDWRAAFAQYRSQVHRRVRFLIESDSVAAFEGDRSKVIFEIIAELVRVGAQPNEIAAVLWRNPYFISKHGQSIEKLNGELWRVIKRLGYSNES